MRQLLQTLRLRFFLLLLIVFGICSLGASGNITPLRGKNTTFSGLTLSPASSNKPDSIVVLFHGYGDIGENFLFLSALWGEFLPNTLFVAPDGPIECKGSSGKQWLRASSKNRPQLLKEINLLTQSLNRYLDGLLKTYGIPPEKLALVGYSQGAKIALHVGLRRPICAGIVAFSGTFLNDPTELRLSRPPILLIHGTEDRKAPPSLAEEAYKSLKALHAPVTLFLIPGLGHDIDTRGSEIAGEFLKECFAGKMKKGLKP
jgi:phospholipase/carboxylesterase